MIQHLHEISEVNYVHDDLLRPNSFYIGLLKNEYKGGETKIKVENDEHVPMMEDKIGKNPI